jgi:hypothetical protein
LSGAGSFMRQSQTAWKRRWNEGAGAGSGMANS